MTRANTNPTPDSTVDSTAKPRPWWLSFYGLFLLCYTIVHLKFEWNFWMEDDAAIFSKYATGDDPAAWMAVAKAVYFTKATWMIVLVWLCALRVPFPRALAFSYFLYGIELMLLFPFNIYNVLNLLLAIGFLLEQLFGDRWRRMPRPVAP